MTVTEDQLRHTAEMLADLEHRRDMLDANIKDLRAQLAADMTVGEVVTDRDGHGLYVLRPGSRKFKADLALASLPEGIRATVMVPTIDGAALKRLSPALWESCCTVGAPTLYAVR